MNWKLRTGDFLRFADDDGGDSGDDNQPGGGGAEPQKSDIDKLRSEYDTKVAALEKQLKALAEETSKSSSETESKTVYNNAAQEVAVLLKELDTHKEPAAALAKARATIESLGHHYATQKSEVHKVQSMYKDARAEAFAASIQFESGGDVNTYKAQLMKAKTLPEMELMAANLRLEVGSKKKTSSTPLPKPDGGSGIPARTNVLKAMEDIDISTPEGRKQWEENRNKFRKAIAV